MKTSFIRKAGVIALSAALFVSMAVPVFADNNSSAEEEYKRPEMLYYLTSPDPQNPDNIIDHTPDTANDYWIDLEKRTVNLEDNEKAYGVFPKYLPELKDSRVYKYALYSDSIDDGYMNFLSSGILANKGHSMELAYYALEGQKKPALEDFSEVRLENIPENEKSYKNAYGFTKDQLLSKDEIEDPDNKLVVSGDITAKGSKDSTSIGTYDRGDAVDLDFSLNAAWFKRYINGLCLATTIGGGTTQDNYESRYNGNAVSDSGLVFTLKLPKEINVSKDVVVSPLDGFDATSEIKRDDQGDQILIIRYQNNENIPENQTLTQLLKKLNEKDFSNIKISISGLTVSSDAEAKQYMIQGTAAGYYDLVRSIENRNYHNYFFFAAKQGEGRDAALPSDGSRNNMISYSFKVSNPTPYVPSTPTEPQQPQKHEVTIHEDNPTTDKPETTTKITVDDQGKVEKPAQDPVRPGYTFDGWYSDPECTIPFDFSKPVTGDIHIYAKWNKNVKPQTAKKVTGILLPKAIANGSSRQTVTWTPLTNVDGYYVYEANCNTPKKTYHFKKVADVKASAPRVYKQSGLKKGVAYKYYVAAYQIKNGKKKVVKKSLSVHSIAGNLMRKRVSYTNVKKVSVNKNAVTLKVGKTYRIQPSVKGVYSNCAILQKGHAAMFRYVYIKDGKNISVSSTGIVKAKKAGKCNVYVLGTNGVRAKVAVTVK